MIWQCSQAGKVQLHWRKSCRSNTSSLQRCWPSFRWNFAWNWCTYISFPDRIFSQTDIEVHFKSM